MAKAKQGDKVKVNYTGRFEDGTVFDSSEGSEPLEFTIGEGQVIPGFEQGVVGMDLQESKTVKISCEDAYGPRKEEMVLAVPKESIPENIKPEAGIELSMSGPNGMMMTVVVVEINDSTVKLDANHPMAGKDLEFDITLEEIV